MIFNNILTGIEECGFSAVQVNLSNVRVLYRIEEDTVYITGLCNLSDRYSMLQEYNWITEQIVDTFKVHYEKKLVLLTIICTDDSGYAKELFSEHPFIWIIDNINNRLLIYENQIKDYFNIRSKIEDRLYENQSATVEGSTVFRYKVSVSVVIILLNVLVFIFVNGVGYRAAFREFMSYGALSWHACFYDNQWYRLFTYMFLHSGIEHLGNNMLLLFVLGSNIEKLLGTLKFTVLYLASGILAGIASISYNMYWNKNVVSVGASGAIFGVVGAMVYFVIAGKGRVRNISNRQMILFVAFSLYGGFTSSRVDNTAHVAGLIAGIVLALLLDKAGKKKGLERDHRI